MNDSPCDVLGIGNALMDVVCNTSDQFLEQHKLIKGSMTLIDAQLAEDLYRTLSPEVECSGGSVANTMAGLASLGSRCSYVGKIFDDILGRKFHQDIQKAGIQFAGRIANLGPATGRCLVLVTPDAMRTMLTFLGASETLTEEDINPDAIRAARVTYLEGYLFDPPAAKQAFRKAAAIAHAAGRQVALSLSDSFCVDRHRDSFRDMLEEHVDILFANEDEILSLFQVKTIQEALRQLRSCCQSAVITRGAQGSIIYNSEEVVQMDAEKVPEVVDTTGAGDLFASGFLFGLSRGQDLATCGRLGSLVAAEIISHFGARPQCSLLEIVSEILGD